MRPRALNLETQRGFSVIELSVCLGLIVLLATGGTLALRNFFRQNQGLDAGSQLRLIWRAQKLFLIDRLDHPQSVALPTLVSDLQPYLDVNHLPDGSSVRVDCLPPLDLRDVSSGTLVKVLSDPKSGDSLYDVGPE